MTRDDQATAVAETRRELFRRAADLNVACWSLDLPTTINGDAHAACPAAAAVTMSIASEPGGGPVQSVFGGRVWLALPDASGAVVADLGPADAASGLLQQRLATALRQYHADLAHFASDAVALKSFSRELTQSYEQVNLVYRMSELLTHGDDPPGVVQTMCDELRTTLDFGWVSVTFGNADAVLAPLRGAVVASGDLPFEARRFQSAVAAIRAAPPVRVLAPATHALAAEAGSELLVERVMHGLDEVGILMAGHRRGGDPDLTSADLQLVGAAAGSFALFHQNAYRFAEQRQQFLGTLHALSAAVDAKDPYTRGHSERVGLLAAQLAARIGMPPAEVEAVRIAGLLHDIGKIGVPEAILGKAGRLTEDEFAQLKGHPVVGYEMLRNLPSLRYQLAGVLHHHEAWDGRGYPHGLAGTAIPIVARILALADTFDAMSSTRAYRPALDRATVVAEIRLSAGRQLDPELVELFVTMGFDAFERALGSAQPGRVEPAAKCRHLA